MRILVTGSRDWNGWACHDVMFSAFQDVAKSHQQVPECEWTVIHGGAHGADMMVGGMAKRFGWPTEVHEARWGELGKAAGPARNQEMVNAGADVCLAFFKKDAANRGTTDCAAKAEAAGIPVRRYTA